MLDGKIKLMVIGHEASLSGAPVLLLNLFNLLIQQEKVSVQFVIRRDGPLVPEYAKIAPVTVLKSTDYGRENNKAGKIINFFSNKLQLAKVLVKATSCDVLFCNTIVNGKLLRWFYLHKKPVITYVHELEHVINLYIKQKDATLPLKKSDIIAYPAEVTKNILTNQYKVDLSKLAKLSYYLPFTREKFDPATAEKKNTDFRSKFRISDNEFLIGSMGVVSNRKGIDLFIDVCEKVVSVKNMVKFCWIGKFESIEQETTIRKLVSERNLGNNIIFTGPLPHDFYNLSPFDIFFLSSREDTYPMVVLEAAIMKVPTACFSGSGGIVEFVADDAGWIIENFSTEKVAEKFIELESDRSAIEKRGRQAFEKAINLHCNPKIVIDQFAAITNQLTTLRN